MSIDYYGLSKRIEKDMKTPSEMQSQNQLRVFTDKGKMRISFRKQAAFDPLKREAFSQEPNPFFEPLDLLQTPTLSNFGFATPNYFDYSDDALFGNNFGKEQKVAEPLSCDSDFSLEDFFDPIQKENHVDVTKTNQEMYLPPTPIFTLPQPQKETLPQVSSIPSTNFEQEKVVDNISNVLVHVGKKKTFRLLRNLIYYRKSTIRFKISCKKKIDFSKFNVHCLLEYKSYGHDNEGYWKLCDTPKGKKGKNGKEKGVFVEYNFPESNDQIDISFCCTYNIKEMCKKTGKNFIRIKFKFFFSENETQELSIPMLWDTHGKQKGAKPIRVKQLKCKFCEGEAFPRIFYLKKLNSDPKEIVDFYNQIKPICLKMSNL